MVSKKVYKKASEIAWNFSTIEIIYSLFIKAEEGKVGSRVYAELVNVLQFTHVSFARAHKTQLANGNRRLKMSNMSTTLSILRYLDGDPFKEEAKKLLRHGWTSKRFWDAYMNKKFDCISEPTIVRMFNAIRDLEIQQEIKNEN